jgi:hypothetical protein
MGKISWICRYGKYYLHVFEYNLFELLEQVEDEDAWIISTYLYTNCKLVLYICICIVAFWLKECNCSRQWNIKEILSYNIAIVNCDDSNKKVMKLSSGLNFGIYSVSVLYRTTLICISRRVELDFFHEHDIGTWHWNMTISAICSSTAGVRVFSWNARSRK